MLRKKQDRILGKKIRKATGIKLPIAMRAAKLINRGFGGFELSLRPLFQDHIETLDNSCECCGTNWQWVLTGPKGSYEVA